MDFEEVHELMEQVFVGVDWATEKHDVCMVDSKGEVLRERVFRNTVPGLKELCDWVRNVGRGAEPRVAIEKPRGLVVSALLDREISVFAINPKQLDRFRDRFCASGAKDDRRDARVLADSLRTDRRAFRRVSPESAEVVELRTWVQIDEDLKAQKTRVSNQLRAQLRRFFPQVLEVVDDLARPWVLDLLKEIPTPEAARRRRTRTIARVLRAHRIRKVTAEAVHEALRQPAFVVAPGTVKAATAHVRLLSVRLRVILRQLSECVVQIDGLLDQLSGEGGGEGSDTQPSDTAILRSLPGAGRFTVANLVAHASNALQSRDYHVLRGVCGVASITRRSGKRLRVTMRRACNARLRKTIHHWAQVAAIIDPHWKARYKALRGRGKTHAAACRSVGDRLLSVAVAMLRSGTLYDPTRLRTTTPSAAA